MIEEIPEALKEAWPLLRQEMNIEVVKLMKEHRDNGTSCEEIGRMAFSCESLLERMDSIMQTAGKSTSKPTRPRLQTF